MKKRIPFSNLLLLLLALSVLEATLYENVAAGNGPPVALQEEDVEESFEEELEEELNLLESWDLFLPLLTEAEHRVLPTACFSSLLCAARPARSLGWSMPLRI